MNLYDLRVRGWVDGVECLVKAACRYAQSVYAAFTHSPLCEWTYMYLQCIVTGSDNENRIVDYFRGC